MRQFLDVPPGQSRFWPTGVARRRGGHERRRQRSLRHRPRANGRGRWTAVPASQSILDEQREGGVKPHGREWVKKTTGYGKAKTVRVARNGVGGTKRAWKPAARRIDCGSACVAGARAPGSGFSVLRASAGRETSGEDGRRQRGGYRHRCGYPGSPPGTRQLPGPKSRSSRVSERPRAVVQPAETSQVAAVRKTPGAPLKRGKVGGGLAKPNERVRTVVRR